MIIRKLLQVFFFILFFFNFSFLKGIETKILATVNNVPITSYELKNKILTTLTLSNQIINQEIINESKNAAMKSLVNIKLKEIEIEKYKIKPNLENVNSYLKEISSNDVDAFKDKFIKNSIDYQIFINEIKTELAWQRLVYSKFGSKVKIEDDLIKNELEILLKNESSQNQFKLSEIEIEVTKENKESKIKNIMNEINNVGFEKTARKLSVSSTAANYGNLGWINSKSLSNEMRIILSNLKINEVSKPITKLNTVLFFKLTDKKSVKINKKNIDNLKKSITNKKANELFKLYSNNYLSKLKSNAFIDFK
jgi:peptidyl-prolyl cis-trans isomerase SurA